MSTLLSFSHSQAVCCKVARSEGWGVREGWECGGGGVEEGWSGGTWSVLSLQPR